VRTTGAYQAREMPTRTVMQRGVLTVADCPRRGDVGGSRRRWAHPTLPVRRQASDGKESLLRQVRIASCRSARELGDVDAVLHPSRAPRRLWNRSLGRKVVRRMWKR
jgi:hypothetical protein